VRRETKQHTHSQGTKNKQKKNKNKKQAIKSTKHKNTYVWIAQPIGGAVKGEELAGLSALQNHGCRWKTDHRADGVHLFVFVLAGEQRLTAVQLDQDTSQAPHVDRTVVVQLVEHLWRAVEPTLNVLVHLVVGPTGTAKIDHLDCATLWIPQQYVLVVHSRETEREREREREQRSGSENN
jgi:hypothetical protein